MGATEQAVADSSRITPAMTDMLAQGRDPTTNSNFRRAFMGTLSQTEQGAMLDPDGNLSAQGQARIRNAVLAAWLWRLPGAAAGDRKHADDNTKALSAALMEAAPEMAQVRKAVEDGRLEPAFDQSAEIAEAVQRISEIRETGSETGSDYLAQQDAFNPIPADVEAWMRMFYNDNLTRPSGEGACHLGADLLCAGGAQDRGTERGFGIGPAACYTSPIARWSEGESSWRRRTKSGTRTI
jgi:hypothetical protein